MIGTAQNIIDGVPGGKLVIFSTDSYHPDSIKSAERNRRGVGEKFLISGMLTKRPNDWKGFLSNEDNKIQFIDLLFRKWKDPVNGSKIKSQNVIFIQNGIATQLSSTDGETITEVDIPLLQSEQEESDTRIILYIHHAQLKGFPYVRICANDSDIFFISLHYAPKLDVSILMDTVLLGY